MAAAPGNWGIFARLVALVLLPAPASFGIPHELQVGIAGHAFDHTGLLSEQAEAAGASGANILYVSGFGVFGYQGLPVSEEMARQRKAAVAYHLRARHEGISLLIGYVCATSMVNLEAFDRNWPAGFRAGFHTPPSAWRQQDRQGHPLPSPTNTRRSSSDSAAPSRAISSPTCAAMRAESNRARSSLPITA